MNELVEHLKKDNEQRSIEMHGFGEVTRILYRILGSAVQWKVSTIRITTDFVEFFRDGALVLQDGVGPFRNAQVPLREKLLQVIEKDLVLASHMRVVKQDETEVIAEFVYDS